MPKVFIFTPLDRIICFQHCKVDIFGFTKDLRIISSDLSSIFIIDNSPGAYRENKRKCFSEMLCSLFRSS